ncbi:MAG TPA: glycine--tRNA ligase [Dehalococcoidia bacterium]|nr:glycine--tRNA ligase [Dehalococcoidia bacterium]
MAESGGARRADMETIVSLCKRRGFVFPSAEIYGGFANTYDYGPLGVELRRQIRAAWWQAMVQEREDVVGIEAAIITNPRVYVASGHLEHFSDPLVDCRACKSRFRADDLPGATVQGAGARMTVVLDLETACPNCGTRGDFTDSRQFNLMFETNVGPVRDDSSVAYLRPETAQGMFVNFENVLNSTRRKLPFGVAQNGKSFRNEITPGNFIFRMLEFEQMEMEYFCYPEQGREMYEYWRAERMRWYVERLGIRSSRLRFYEHPQAALSHYSSGTTDVEYEFPFGWGELEGIAYRTDFDLRRHSEQSGRQLSYFDDERKEHVVPHVVEPAAGVDRIMAVLLLDAYDEEQDDRGETRVVLRFKPELAPVQVAILPLSRNEKLVPTARDVWTRLRPHFRTQYDDAQSIGRRYRRQDEIGTPLCVTVDFQTVEEDQAVTIRDRDSMEQVRVGLDALRSRLEDLLGGR